MNLVISYTSVDREKLRPLLDGLRRLRHGIWLDQELSGGQVWWDTILGHIRNSDALLMALTPAILESEACTREAEYARRVGKPILPVMIERVRPELLAPSLAAVQIVDFTEPDGKAAFDLMAALSELPSPKPLPDPLPDPPPVPVSYLSDLSERVAAPRLDLDQQLSLVGKLRPGLARPRERDAVLEIIQRFRARNDLYLAPAQELDALLSTAAEGQSTSQAPPGPVGGRSGPTTTGPPKEDTSPRDRSPVSRKQVSRLAVAAPVVGFVGCLFAVVIPLLGLMLGLVAMVLGGLGLREITASKGATTGRGAVAAGILLGLIALAFAFPFLQRSLGV